MIVVLFAFLKKEMIEKYTNFSVNIISVAFDENKNKSSIGTYMNNSYQLAIDVSNRYLQLNNNMNIGR